MQLSYDSISFDRRREEEKGDRVVEIVTEKVGGPKNNNSRNLSPMECEEFEYGQGFFDEWMRTIFSSTLKRAMHVNARYQPKRSREEKATSAQN